jgi:dipeptidase D
VVLQAHLDMVCEKDGDVVHDFERDPLRPRVAGDWVVATGTTLGADNGIGVAAALAAATDPAVVHGPLELLFTVDEETGLTGAQGLDGALISGRVLLNLDSEEDGKLFIGCAGGADGEIVLPLARQAPPRDARSFELVVRGLRGGHSGLNIHEGRGNALKLVVRLLQAAREAGLPFDLSALGGGGKHNAIPREARAELWLSAEAAQRFRGVLACMGQGFRDELAGVDDGLELRLDETAPPRTVVDRDDRDRLLDLLAILPHGVLAMSRAISGLVETSNNLAVVDVGDGAARIVTSSRSSVRASQEALLATLRAAARMAGTELRSSGGYPGWKPDPSSSLLRLAREVLRSVTGREPEVTAVHAGLECGLLGERVPGLEMISFGPEIQGAHSPGERVQISSVQRFWTALVALLDALAGARVGVREPAPGPPARSR